MTIPVTPPGDYGHEEIPSDVAFDLKDIQILIEKIKIILAGAEAGAATADFIQKIKDEIAKIEAFVKSILAKI